MEGLLQLTFLERGIIAGLVIGFICPFVGAFLLVRRITVISEALSHITLTGVTAGVFLSQLSSFIPFFNPMVSGLVFSLIGSIFVEKLRQIYKHFQEVAIPIILSAGIGLSALLISLTSSSITEWYSYLFGSIVTVSSNDLIFILVTGGIVFLLLILMYKELLSISFDLEFASTNGVSVRKINFFFSLFVALVISISMKIVGILLVGAIVTLPVAASTQFAKSFKQIIYYGILFSELSIVLGILASYYFDIATGGMIVVFNVIILMITLILKRVKSSVFQDK